MSILKEAWFVVINRVATLCEMSNEKVRKIEECADNATSAYKEMPDVQLDKEVNWLKNHTYRSKFEKAAKMKILKEEL